MTLDHAYGEMCNTRQVDFDINPTVNRASMLQWINECIKNNQTGKRACIYLQESLPSLVYKRNVSQHASL